MMVGTVKQINLEGQPGTDLGLPAPRSFTASPCSFMRRVSEVGSKVGPWSKRDRNGEAKK